ncbi:MAG: hypothetical protein HQM10_05690 [Candidatus Riflebacteria bacterium]|nr:hypothetical protein [Candidatus Riflebacteria bacterium]
MNGILKSLFAAAIMFSFNSTVDVSAAPVKKTVAIDGTHIVNKRVEKLVKKVKRQTKKEYAAKHRAPEPEKKIYKLGDEESFWATNVKENKQYQLKATLKAIGPNSYIFLENGKSVSDADLKRISDDFENKVYKTNVKYFGAEWNPGIDNDVRMTLLLLDIQDNFSPEGDQGYVGGYFFAGDEFLQSDIPADVDVKSNEREMLYLDIYPSDPTSGDYLAVVAHEHQHMVHFAHDPNEFTWLNEGCSMISMYLNGYGHQSQIKSFMEQPDVSLTAWSDKSSIANYGINYLFNFYLLERFLKTDASRVDFYTNHVDNKLQGVDSFDEKLKKSFGTDFQKFFTEFAVTNFVNNPKLGNGEFSYTDSALNKFKLPVCKHVKAFPAEITEQVYLWSADGIKVDLSTAKSSLKIEFAGSYAAFTEGKHIAYEVIAVLTDSRDRTTPEMKKITLAPSADKKIQSGALDLVLDGKFDTMTIVVSAQAPMGIPDAAYAKAPAIPYAIEIKDAGTQIARSENSVVSVSALVSDYENAAASLNSSNEEIQLQAYNTLESVTYELSRSVTADCEIRSTKSIDEIIEAVEKAESKESLKPLVKKIVDVLNNKNLQDNLKIEDKIQTLKSL